ncbi:hypothetical protein OWV82_006268 [Melia azedarach]|uniref:Uncharacterized protein n=1 Tax=Melia azedarach TaxID=155640 RepID=A0ACC1YG73_MELAZ|nr:hypothetical protein OWV82_006268 [Melia azedarach]
MKGLLLSFIFLFQNQWLPKQTDSDQIIEIEGVIYRTMSTITTSTEIEPQAQSQAVSELGESGSYSQILYADYYNSFMALR